MTGSQGRNQDFVSGVLISLPVNEKGLKKDGIEAKKKLLIFKYMSLF
jgi:hypothetical protein